MNKPYGNGLDKDESQFDPNASTNDEKEQMNYDPEIHHRKSIRLRKYDYSRSGLYFITICCQNRVHLFGYIENGKIITNESGKIANECWLGIPTHFSNVILHEHIIMPNHIHGIIELVGEKYLTAEMKNHSPNNIVRANHPSSKNTLIVNNEMKNETKDGAKNISPLRKTPSKTIGSIVRGFKIGVTKWMRQNTNIHDIWQRNYYEHIIRDKDDYHTTSRYIVNNPKNWENDELL